LRLRERDATHTFYLMIVLRILPQHLNL